MMPELMSKTREAASLKVYDACSHEQKLRSGTYAFFHYIVPLTFLHTKDDFTEME
jgi:hypothetical protein